MICECAYPHGTPGIRCSKKEVEECVREACDKGNLLNSGWQSLHNAWECTDKWTKKTGIPHYVAVQKRTAGSDDPNGPPPHTDGYILQSCPIDRVYDTLFGDNRDTAEFCASQWNTLFKNNNRPADYNKRLHFRAKKVVSRTIFSDIWVVSAKVVYGE